MDTHRALIAMGGVGARLLDHGQRVRFALKMGLWGPKWPRASAARADGKNVSMHLCSFGRFLPVLSPTFAFATSTALVPWICQGVPFLTTDVCPALAPGSYALNAPLARRLEGPSALLQCERSSLASAN